MANFVGATVRVTLRDPPGAQAEGKVKNIQPGHSLYLENVLFLGTGVTWPAWAVENWMMADLEIIKSPTPQAPPAVELPVRPAPQQHAPAQSSSQHADPAILSYARPTPPTPAHTAPSMPATNVETKTKPKKQRQKEIAKEHMVLNTDVSRNGNDMNSPVKRGKGWRQDPLLQPVEGKKRRRQRQIDGEAQNGWATEDATDVQDMGEFDFEANLKLFNKEQVFEQLRKDDTTADEDRLVSHNKLPPRKNLLPTEMVLSPKLVDGSDADTEKDFTGRSSSRQSKRQGSRANSGYLPHMTASFSSERAPSRASRKGRPLPAKLKTSDHSPAPRRSTEHLAPHFSIGNARRLCPVLLPQALQTLEAATTARYGISADAVTELAARAIAEETIRLLEPEFRRPSRTNTARAGLNPGTPIDTTPVVVVLVGNHTSGARALAAVRHLVTRKYKVVISEGIFEASTVNDPQYATQLQAVKKAAREGAGIKRGTWQKANAYIKNLAGPPVAIIDALFAGGTYDDLLAVADELTATALEDARQMIDWANRSRAPVISISAPSGVSGIDGSAAIVDGEPLAIRPDKLLALGAPLSGVLEAVKGGERWDISVVDIGINIALKSDDAVDFGGSWVSPLHFEGA